MHFGIFNSEGNALAWFDREEEARAALSRMAGRGGLPGDLALISFEGELPTGEVEVRSAPTEARFVSFVTPDFDEEPLDPEIGVKLHSQSTARVREVVLN